MKKSNGFSSKTIAKKDLLNGTSVFTLALIFIFLILLLLGTLGPTLVKGELVLSLAQRLAKENYYSYMFDIEQVFSLACLVIPFLTALLQFCFLHQKEYCYTNLSFAVTRKQLYRNRMALPLAVLLGVTLIIKGIALAINIKYIGFHIIGEWLVHLLIYLQIIITTYAVTVFCCHFCGRTIEAAAASISAFVLPIGLTMLIEQGFCVSLYGGDYFEDTILTKAINLINPLPLTDLAYTTSKIAHEPSADLTGRVIMSIIWFLFSIALLVFTGKYFQRKYKPEICGFKGARSGIVYLISLSLPMFVSYFAIDYVVGYYYPLSNNKVQLVSFLAAFAFGVLGAVLVNFLIHFTFRRIKVALLSGATIGAVIGVVFLIGFSGIFGTYNKLPATEDIDSIMVDMPFDGFVVEYLAGDMIDNTSVSTAQSFIFTEEEEFKLVQDIHKAVLEDRQTKSVSAFTVVYYLKNGESIRRSYSYLSDTALEKTLMLWDTPTVKKHIEGSLVPELVYTEYDDDTLHNDASYHSSNTESQLKIYSKHNVCTNVLETLTAEQALELRKAAQSDVANSTYYDWFRPEGEYLGYIYFDTITDRHYMTAPYEYSNQFSFVLPVYSNMENILNALQKYGLMDELTATREIKRMFIADIREMVEWRDAYLKGTDMKYITKPYFYNMSFLTIADIEGDYKKAPITQITDRNEMKEIMDACHGYYLVGNNKMNFVFVEYKSDEAVMFEEQNYGVYVK